MKRTLSLLLAVLMTLTAFGAVSVFSGVIGAGAEFLDYFNYVQIPGFTAYSKEGLLNQNNTTVDFLDFTTDYLPEGNVVDKVATFTVVGHDTWGGIEIHSFNKRSEFDSFSGNWSANDLIDGKDIFGDTDLNFEGASGIMFWISANGANIQSNVSLSVSRVPCQGPYYSVSEDNGTQDMIDHPVGFLYGAKGRAPDADGYVYFDFKTDFSQSDWWSRDDDGNNQYEQGQTPIPKSKLPLISGLKITVGGLQIGDTVSIGDMRICYDTRIHTDALDEQISHFDSLDPEAYTEESYLAASEAYFKAYEVFLDPINQDQVDEVETALRVAIANLKPLFHAPNKDIMLEGFESWTEDDLDTMAGLGLDTPIIDEEVVPENKESSVMIMANAVNGEPTWGWSWFTSGSEEGAVGNPFALKEGSAPLSEAAGIRFWVKWDESLEPIPTSMRVGVGSSASGAYFECEDYYITLPETEGYVGIPWTNLYDLNGEYDIYDYIDELDYISILIEGAVGIYYIADLHAFNWDVSSADFAELDKAISEAYAYMDSLTENEWHPVTWDNVYAAIVAAENLIGKYGVTQDEVDEAQKSINDCINAMIPIGDAPTRENSNKLNALFAAGRSYWRGNVTPASYRELMITIDAIEPLIQKGITNDHLPRGDYVIPRGVGGGGVGVRGIGLDQQLGGETVDLCGGLIAGIGLGDEGLVDLAHESLAGLLGGDTVLLLGQDHIGQNLIVLEGVHAVHVVAGHDAIHNADVNRAGLQLNENVGLCGKSVVLLTDLQILFSARGHDEQGTHQHDENQCERKNFFHNNKTSVPPVVAYFFAKPQRFTTLS